MNAMLLTVFLALPSAVVGQVADGLPGDAYSRPAEGTVLRAGPGIDFPGVLTLDGATVVRTGALAGTYREVFVPQGYAVYMHGDYLELNEADATVTVTGDRVNMRLLPSADGLLPIASLGKGTGPLVLLGRTGDWVRLLAPLAAPLYAADGEVGSIGAADPAWQREAELLQRVEELADTDVAQLPPEELAQRRKALAEIADEAAWTGTRQAAETIRQELESAERLRTATERAADVVKRQVELDALSAQREARMLALGLRFTGRGEAVTRRGSLHREWVVDAPIYTLHTTDGEILKLTAAPEVATLPALVGKQVELAGRKLFLTPVRGPVLVIDRVVSYRPAR
jgi:hypothetical protein